MLYRDTWGVAHIYAPTVAAGLYAQGWAQAEDRPEQLLLNLKMGMGEFASVVGEAGVETDLRSHLWDHYGAAKSRFEELRPEVREHLEAFVAGINDWYAAHPDDVPAWWGDRKVDPYMVVAFGRLFVYNWSIDEVYGDLERGGIEPGIQSRPARLEPVRDRARTFRREGGDPRHRSASVVGRPVALLGVPHPRRRRSWGAGRSSPARRTSATATTDGGLGDDHGRARHRGRLRAHARPADPSRYRYDGEWRSLTTREVTIAVRDQAAPAAAIRQPLWFSHHGPIIATLPARPTRRRPRTPTSST